MDTVGIVELPHAAEIEGLMAIHSNRDTTNR